MKASSLGLLIAASLFIGSVAHAQYKGPRDYFQKNTPVPGVNSPTSPRTPGQQPAAPQSPGTPSTPAAPAQPKFKDVAVNGQFYFGSDTNRTFAWMKISATTAKNTKNGVTAAINAETPVQK